MMATPHAQMQDTFLDDDIVQAACARDETAWYTCLAKYAGGTSAIFLYASCNIDDTCLVSKDDLDGNDCPTEESTVELCTSLEACCPPCQEEWQALFNCGTFVEQCPFDCNGRTGYSPPVSSSGSRMVLAAPFSLLAVTSLYFL